MKITETLDQLLRALRPNVNDDDLDATSTPASAGSSESAATKMPIRAAVPAWERRDEPSPVGGDADASGSAGHEHRFTTADTEVPQPGEHVLPEWVRRAQERAVPFEPETAAVEIEPVPATVESESSLVSSDVEAIQPAEVAQPAVDEPGPTETEPFAVDEPTPADANPPVVDEPISVAPLAMIVESAFAPAEIDVEALFSSVVEPLVVEEPISAEVEVPAAEPAEPMETGTTLVLAGLDLTRLETAASLAESLNLGFHLGLAVERIANAAAQGSSGVPALREAAWLIERYIALLERRPIGADLHASAVRLARAGDAIADLKALAAALEAPPQETEHPAGEAPGDQASETGVSGGGVDVEP